MAHSESGELSKYGLRRSRHHIAAFIHNHDIYECFSSSSSSSRAPNLMDDVHLSTARHFSYELRLRSESGELSRDGYRPSSRVMAKSCQRTTAVPAAAAVTVLVMVVQVLAALSNAQPSRVARSIALSPILLPRVRNEVRSSD